MSRGRRLCMEAIVTDVPLRGVVPFLGSFTKVTRNVHVLGQTLGDSEGQGGLLCCSPRGCKEKDTTGGLNNNSWERIYLKLLR